MLGQRGKETRRWPSLLVGLGGEIGPDQPDGRKPQLGQEQRDTGGVELQTEVMFVGEFA